MELMQFQKAFQPHLDRVLGGRIADLARLMGDEFLLSILNHSLELAKTGKRVRPFMVKMAYEAFGGDSKNDIWNALVGMEIFHMFALVHDDIMDEATTRRGVITTHMFVANELNVHGRHGSARKIGESHAILLGDLLLSWSMSQFEDLDLKVRQQFSVMSNEVILGQMIDIDLSTQDMPPKELIDQKMILKTASYSFIRPLLIGLNLAGGSEEQAEFCKKFGLALGVAFQIQDDLLDLISNELEIKKPVFSDLRERQQTLFTRHILGQGTEKERDRLSKLHGNPELNESDRNEILDLFTSSGAIKAGRLEMKKNFDQAEKLVNNAPISERFRQEFLGLVRFIRKRVS